MMKNKTQRIAWEGWSLPARPEWRPIQLAGDRRRGRMLIGDAAQHVLLVQWWRPGARFDFAPWLRRRLRQVAEGQPPDAVAPVTPAGFTSVAGVTGRTFRGSVGKSLWYGHAPEDHLVLEITVNEAAEEPAGFVRRHVLPAVGIMPLSGYVCWSVFDTRFESPPGFVLQRRSLHAGHIALELAGPERRSLLVRQVYPAATALAKLPLERWIAATPFPKQRPITDLKQEPVVIGAAKPLAGICQRGWRRHAFPLRRFRPLRTHAVAVVDPSLNRILMAELTGGGEREEHVASRAVAQMNPGA